jgi:holo-[acyl-carrier protein] synthase
MSLHVGIDLVSVREVEEAIAEHGDRYLTRVFTEQERLECRSRPDRLAARFAAKEATLKALRVQDEGVNWLLIAVKRSAHGEPGIELAGEIAELAERRGLQSLTVSLTHERDHAAAVVLMEATS